MDDSAPSSMHIIGSKGLGGAETFYLRLVQALAERVAGVQAINPPHSGVARALGDGITQHHVAMRSVFDPVSRYRIARIVRRERPAVVQTYMGRATRLTRIPRRWGIVHIARLGGYYNPKGYRHAHAWIGNTRGICDYLIREGFPAERVFHIGNFVDPAEPVGQASLKATRSALELPQDALTVVGVGRLHPNKDFATLLEAFARLPDTIGGYPVHLVIVGDGPLRESLRDHAAGLGIASRIHWPGWQNDTRAWYQLADVFVCPSRHEPLGNVILEAWANGAPVISTRTQGPAELITHGRDGLLVSPEDSDALAASMKELLSADASVRGDLAGRGRATLAAHHGRDAVIDQYMALYRRLTSGRSL